MGRSADDRVHSIFEALTRDHRLVAGMFRELASLGDTELEERADLFADLQERLLAHGTAEDQVVYARFARLAPLADLVRDARKEHGKVDALLDELDQLEPEEPEWMIKIGVLRELVARHVDHEEGLLFELAKQEIDGAESSQLAAEFERLTRRLIDDDRQDDHDDLDPDLDDLELDDFADDRWQSEAPPLGARG